jgi:hypothetical protein
MKFRPWPVIAALALMSCCSCVAKAGSDAGGTAPPSTGSVAPHAVDSASVMSSRALVSAPGREISSAQATLSVANEFASALPIDAEVPAAVRGLDLSEQPGTFIGPFCGTPSDKTPDDGVVRLFGELGTLPFLYIQVNRYEGTTAASVMSKAKVDAQNCPGWSFGETHYAPQATPTLAGVEGLDGVAIVHGKVDSPGGDQHDRYEFIMNKGSYTGSFILNVNKDTVSDDEVVSLIKTFAARFAETVG